MNKSTFYHQCCRHALYLLILFLAPTFVFSQWEELNLPKGDKIIGIETDGDAILAMMPDGIYRWKPGISWKKCHSQQFEQYATFKYADGAFYINDANFLSNNPILFSGDQGETWQVIKHFQFNKEGFRTTGSKSFIYNLPGDSLFVTPDSGEHWSYLPEAVPATTKILAYEVIGDTVVIFLNDRITRSLDNGITWQSLPSPESFPAGSNPYGRLLAVQGVWYINYNGGNVYRSHDNGDTWQALGNVPLYNNIWRVGNRIYAEGTSYSDDFGLTWTRINTPGYYLDFLEFKGKLTLSCNFGLYEDAGDFLWHSLNTHFPVGVNTSAFDEFQVIPTKSNILVSSGYYSPDGGANWYLPQAAEGIGTQATVKGDTVVCYSIVGGSLPYTTDGGIHWDTLPTGNTGVPFSPVFKGDTLFVVTTADKVWYTVDLGENWLPANVPPDLSTYKIAAGAGKLYLMDSSNKKVYRSPDGGQTWENLSNGFPQVQFSFVMFANDNGVFIGADAALYRYDEQSQQWVISNAGLGAAGNVIRAMPASGNKVAAIRSDFNNVRGLFIAPDGGLHWYDALIAGIYLYASATAAGFSTDYLYTAAINLDNNTRHLLRRPLSGITSLPVTGTVHGMIQPGVPNVVVRLRSGNGATVPALNSAYELHGLIGLDTIEIAPIPGYSDILPEYWVLSQAAPGYDFYLGIPDPVCSMSITPFTPFKADAETTLAIDLGCIPDTGQTVTAKIFLPLNLTYVHAQPGPSTVNGSLLEWIGLPQNNSGFPEINLTVRTDIQAQIGDTVLISGEFKKGNITAKDTLVLEVVSSFDPNDKQCVPKKLSVQQGQSGALLDYTIRFQNTGTFTAETVRISDTIVSDIDISSIQLVATSHPGAMSILPGNVVEFLFNDIMLPDSNLNEPASHGFVRFTARSKPGLVKGDSVLNRAAIYFDLNAPVITNTCSTIVEEAVSNVETVVFEPALKLQLSPNPASEKVTLTVPGYSLKNTTITVTDVTGKTILTFQNNADETFGFSSANLLPGMWFIKVRHHNWIASGSLSIQH